MSAHSSVGREKPPQQHPEQHVGTVPCRRTAFRRHFSRKNPSATPLKTTAGGWPNPALGTGAPRGILPSAAGQPQVISLRCTRFRLSQNISFSFFFFFQPYLM